MFDFNVESIAAAAAESPDFRIAATGWTAEIVLRMGEETYRLTLRDGTVVGFGRIEDSARADLRVSGPAEAWNRLLMAPPPPLNHDPLFGGGDQAGFVVEGDH